MIHPDLPIPDHFLPERVGELWRVPYQERFAQARAWAGRYGLGPAHGDSCGITLVLVDVQNTFCLPDFELFVAGRSGTGAVDDNRRLCEFIYRNLGTISQICPTMDTHRAVQIFHSVFLVNESGEHPPPYTLVTLEEIENSTWRFNGALAPGLGIDAAFGQRYLEHYAARLAGGGKYALTVWPFHAMLGGVGHAMVPAVEEAVFFHAMTRLSSPDFQIKGDNPLTENYSVLRPEVMTGPTGEAIAETNRALTERLLDGQAVIIAGQAKSHCVAWTVQDLLEEILCRDETLCEKIYLLEDCSSPVVIPGVIDYTDPADEIFSRFAAAGMHVVQSTEPMAHWPGPVSTLFNGKDNG
jgi:nicotinamidase-related amidase